MPEEQAPDTKHERAPYVKPRILTFKIDLSFASSETNLEDIIALADSRQVPTPNKELALKAKATEA